MLFKTAFHVDWSLKVKFSLLKEFATGIRRFGNTHVSSTDWAERSNKDAKAAYKFTNKHPAHFMRQARSIPCTGGLKLPQHTMWSICSTALNSTLHERIMCASRRLLLMQLRINMSDQWYRRAAFTGMQVYNLLRLVLSVRS